MGNSHAARGNEAGWRVEIGLPHVGDKVIPEVGAVEQIEDLKYRLDVRPFLDLEVLSQAQINLGEGLAPLAVKVTNRTRAGP